jgi:hypothetical protein
LKNKFVLPALGILAIGAALAGGTFVHAQTITAGTSQYPSIIQRLVDRFGLKTAEVQAVFDQANTDRQAEMKAKEQAHLDRLVTDGKITPAQEQLIVAKRAEMEANWPTEPVKDSSLTPVQMKAKMEAQKTELETWAKTNGIDVKYLFGGFCGKGFGGHGMRGEMPSTPAN